MAIEAGTATPELNTLLAQLTEPFDPSEIKWRVTHTTRDASRGAVIAFADPRAYSDRLNQIFTPSGWTRTYEVNTVSSITRMKKDKLVQTGKVLVTCTVTIAGLGTHADSGEQWADEENAMTSAQAQAFKRACTCFGLGRYLYNFAEMWVPLNQHRQPLHLPALPKWALPKSSPTVRTNSAAHPPAMQRGPIDQKTTAKIEGFKRILGDSIYGRSFGGSRARGRRTRFRTHNFRPTYPMPWNAQRVASAKRILFPKRLAIRSLCRCSIICRSRR